jgi:hypothetical protein
MWQKAPAMLQAAEGNNAPANWALQLPWAFEMPMFWWFQQTMVTISRITCNTPSQQACMHSSATGVLPLTMTSILGQGTHSGRQGAQLLHKRKFGKCATQPDGQLEA